MNGILHIDSASVEATSGRMFVTFKSGGDPFRFHFPPHVAVKFRQAIMENGWQVLCAPDAELVHLKPKKKQRAS